LFPGHQSLADRSSRQLGVVNRFGPKPNERTNQRALRATELCFEPRDRI
jgi:hypothetical protein